MAKQTLEQKIEKTEDAILKEELLIEESKGKLKKLRDELKSLKSEKEKAFANEIIELIKAKGISHEKLIADLKAIYEKKDESYKSSEIQKNDNTTEAQNEETIMKQSQSLSLPK